MRPISLLSSSFGSDYRCNQRGQSPFEIPPDGVVFISGRRRGRRATATLFRDGKSVRLYPEPANDLPSTLAGNQRVRVLEIPPDGVVFISGRRRGRRATGYLFQDESRFAYILSRKWPPSTLAALAKVVNVTPGWRGSSRRSITGRAVPMRHANCAFETPRRFIRSAISAEKNLLCGERTNFRQFAGFFQQCFQFVSWFHLLISFMRRRARSSAAY